MQILGRETMGLASDRWTSDNVDDLVLDYLELAPLYLGRIREGLVRSDAGGIWRAALPFRFSSQCVGAVLVANLAGKIESHALAGHLKAISPLLEKIEKAFQAVRDELKESL
jgi:hypothetical protein